MAKSKKHQAIIILLIIVVSLTMVLVPLLAVWPYLNF